VLLLEDELELEELLLEDELELLELEELLLEDELELEELLLEELELELLELEELLLEDELELEELLLDDVLEVLELEELELLVPSPAQVGATKLPSWPPWKPKEVLLPGASACHLQQLVNWKVVPGLAPDAVTFQLLVSVTVSGKVSVTVQPLTCVVPLLVTVTSTW
jgi:hypothetical protein